MIVGWKVKSSELILNMIDWKKNPIRDLDGEERQDALMETGWDLCHFTLQKFRKINKKFLKELDENIERDSLFRKVNIVNVPHDQEEPELVPEEDSEDSEEENMKHEWADNLLILGKVLCYVERGQDLSGKYIVSNTEELKEIDWALDRLRGKFNLGEMKQFVVPNDCGCCS